MITLGTGLPGNGKTLYMLWYIKQKAEKEKREVFYHNVKDLNADVLGGWQSFEPEKWMDLPHGSIIFIDECQEVFPRKPNGAQLPTHYEELAKHRHKGFDIYLVTQHPTLIDNFVRRLVGQHFHSVRKFGLQRATIYEWANCNPAPETPSSQKSAIPLKWAYPKEVFGWYKSAEVHTVKRSIPAKLILAVLFVFAVLAGGWWALDRFQARGQKAPDPIQGEQVAAAPGAVPEASRVSPGGVGQSEVFDPIADARQWTAMNTPRLEGLPHTAPKYDQLTTPTRVPVPAACIQVGQAGRSKRVSCKCFTQQGTPMDVGYNQCVEFARNGYFQDFDADRDRQQDERTARGVQTLADKPDQPIRQNYGAPQVLAFADLPDLPRIQGARPAPNLNDGPPNGRPTRTAIAE